MTIWHVFFSFNFHFMNTTWPKEFLTLPIGEAENYREMYGMRLKAADTCPNNGSRENCPCVEDESPRVGMTAWNKINLNVTSLSINRKLWYIATFANDCSCVAYDFTFTQQLHGMVVPYGESGDCYSMANCPQGKFSINLTETSIQYGCRGSRLLLYLLGRNMNILTFQENQIVYGKGGGYCGTCEPDHYQEPQHGV